MQVDAEVRSEEVRCTFADEPAGSLFSRFRELMLLEMGVGADEESGSEPEGEGKDAGCDSGWL